MTVHLQIIHAILHQNISCGYSLESPNMSYGYDHTTCFHGEKKNLSGISTEEVLIKTINDNTPPSSIYNKGSGPPPSGPQKGSHIDKQRRMHVETLPRRQTTPYAHLEDSPGRAAASPRPEPLRPQVSMVRAPGALNAKKRGTYLNTKTIPFIWCPASVLLGGCYDDMGLCVLNEQ